jgi:hypothetical protein
MCESLYSIERSMSTMCKSSKMCNVKTSTNMSSVKATILV